MKEITSLQNPRVKEIVALSQKSSERRRQGCFVVEGVREVERCVESGFNPRSLFLCEGQELSYALADIIPSDILFKVSKAVYSKMAYREGTEGLIAVFQSRHIKLEDLQLGANPLIIVLESVEKPGNLGAVLRTADAAKADAVVICDPLTDIYNPNVIRSSLGAVFTVPCVACASEECIRFLKKRSVQILTAQLQDSVLYYDTDMCVPTAIIMGTESTGLTNQWRAAADRHIRIPMLGSLDSLNVSVSTAILTFEAIRQRQPGKS